MTFSPLLSKAPLLTYVLSPASPISRSSQPPPPVFLVLSQLHKRLPFFSRLIKETKSRPPPQARQIHSRHPPNAPNPMPPGALLPLLHAPHPTRQTLPPHHARVQHRTHATNAPSTNPTLEFLPRLILIRPTAHHIDVHAIDFVVRCGGGGGGGRRTRRVKRGITVFAAGDRGGEWGGELGRGGKMLPEGVEGGLGTARAVGFGV